jgi:hypothetical protein
MNFPPARILGSDSSFRQSIVFWSGVAVLNPKFAQESESGLRSRRRVQRVRREEAFPRTVCPSPTLFRMKKSQPTLLRTQKHTPSQQTALIVLGWLSSSCSFVFSGDGSACRGCRCACTGRTAPLAPPQGPRKLPGSGVSGCMTDSAGRQVGRMLALSQSLHALFLF